MSAKYTVTTTDTTVTIRERGVSGTLTFGVGGPIAAMAVSDLAEEVNKQEVELAALRRVFGAARKYITIVNNFCEQPGDEEEWLAALAEYDKCRAA